MLTVHLLPQHRPNDAHGKRPNAWLIWQLFILESKVRLRINEKFLLYKVETLLTPYLHLPWILNLSQIRTLCSVLEHTCLERMVPCLAAVGGGNYSNHVATCKDQTRFALFRQNSQWTQATTLQYYFQQFHHVSPRLDTCNRPTGGGVTLWVPVLVSYGCYNKLPLSSWLNTTPMYYLTVLEIRSPNWDFLGKKQDIGRAEFLWTLEGRFCFLTVPPFRDCCILWLLAPFHLQSQWSHPSDLCFCWLDLLLWCWFFCLFPL